MSSYTDRDLLIQNWGYESYAYYLQSDKWKRLRADVLKRDNFRCAACGNRACEVHHRSYGKQVMSGGNSRELVSLCSRCHETVEFDETGRKRSLAEANVYLDRMIERKAKRRRKQHADKKAERKKLRDKGLARCFCVNCGYVVCVSTSGLNRVGSAVKCSKCGGRLKRT